MTLRRDPVLSPGKGDPTPEDRAKGARPQPEPQRLRPLPSRPLPWAATGLPGASPPSTGPPSRRLYWPRVIGLKTLDLYVARLYIFHYVVVTVSFVGLFVLIEAFGKLDRFMSQETQLLETLLRYHLAMIPSAYASHLGPVLTLAAAMFTLTTIQRQNELTPLKASGISVYRALAPIFVLSLLLAGLSFVLKEEILPRYKEPIRNALALSRSRPLSPPPYYDQEQGLLIRVAEYSTTRNIGRGIEISEQHPNLTVKQFIDANQMEWIPDSRDPDNGVWILREGTVQSWDDQGNLIVHAAAREESVDSAAEEIRLKTSFDRKVLQTTLRPIDLETSDIEISYLSWKDLKQQYERQPYHRHLAVKLHNHFASPMAHIVLLFLGLPFVLHLRTRNTFLSLAICTMICGLFYLLSTICMNLANQSEILTPILAAWLPVMIFGALGITLLDNIPT